MEQAGCAVGVESVVSVSGARCATSTAAQPPPRQATSALALPPERATSAHANWSPSYGIAVELANPSRVLVPPTPASHAIDSMQRATRGDSLRRANCAALRAATDGRPLVSVASGSKRGDRRASELLVPTPTFAAMRRKQQRAHKRCGPRPAAAVAVQPRPTRPCTRKHAADGYTSLCTYTLHCQAAAAAAAAADAAWELMAPGGVRAVSRAPCPPRGDAPPRRTAPCSCRPHRHSPTTLSVDVLGGEASVQRAPTRVHTTGCHRGHTSVLESAPPLHSARCTAGAGGTTRAPRARRLAPRCTIVSGTTMHTMVHPPAPAAPRWHGKHAECRGPSPNAPTRHGSGRKARPMGANGHTERCARVEATVVPRLQPAHARGRARAHGPPPARAFPTTESDAGACTSYVYDAYSISNAYFRSQEWLPATRRRQVLPAAVDRARALERVERPRRHQLPHPLPHRRPHPRYRCLACQLP